MPETLQAGERLSSFYAKDLRDKPLEVRYGAEAPKRVLLYFTPPCPYCRGQFAYWREILERADSSNFEVMGLVADSEDKSKVEEYLRSVGCGADSTTPLRVALVSEEIRRQYKLTATPMTLLVASDGAVEQVWSGRWDASALAGAGPIFGLNFSPR